jgi:hypothetical protein
MSADKQNDEGFHVSKWVDVLGGFIAHNKPLWIKLGNWETRLLSEQIANVPIERPIYVCGLARSGSTILLEILSQFDDTVTHRYKDYPLLFTPYFWNWFLNHVPARETEAVERTHRDGIMITPDSPEAFEEVLWMAFFPNIHDPTKSSALNDHTNNADFEAFYRDHIRKLLAIRKGSRYVSKGNYNITRMEYLLRIFPDARFVIPVREPSWHIASLMKQHALLCEGERHNPRALEHMRRVGHFEFGLDRRPVNAGDRACIDQVIMLWKDGDEIEGWARYWAHIHGYIADTLEANPRLRDASLIVPFEALCSAPEKTLREILEHCNLTCPNILVRRLAERVQAPTYYEPSFSQAEFELIDRLTWPVAERFGYAEAGLRRFRGWLA